MADQAPAPSPTDPSAGSLTAEDRSAIEELVATYVLSLDVDDVDRVFGLFTPDATFITYDRVFSGPTLRRMFETAPKGLHLAGRNLIQPHPEGAVVRLQLVFYPADRSPHRLAIYDKIAVKTEGRWYYRRVECRFLNREGALGSRP
jgi:SnoaL-like domain